MATVLEPTRRKLDVVAYHQLAESGWIGPDERVELIDGEIIAMSPIGSRHGSATSRLVERLVRDTDPAEVMVTGSMALRVDAHNEPEPDVLVLRRREDDYAARHPGPADVLLLVEVADSSIAFDRARKAALYARAGIPEYWIVDLANRQLLRFTAPSADAFADTSTHRDGVLRPTLFGAVVDVAQLLR